MECRLSLAVQLVLVLAAPSLALAQHGASMPAAHSGVAAHPGPSFSGPARSFAPPSMPAHQPGSQIGRQGHWPSWTPSQSPNDGRHRPYVTSGYFPFSYGLPFAFGLPYGEDPQDAAAPAPPPAIDYGQEPQVATNAPPAFRPAYQGPIEFAPVHAQPATTLVFKDGRPPAQVHNYALTGSTLYALDGDSRQEIPLSLLNVPATVDANRAAGVDFALPASR